MESEGDDDNHDPQGIIISEHDEEYGFLAEAHETINNSNLLAGSTKGKYYKQTYRPAWEHMPDFKGWLRGVSGEPTRAYCVYCQKTLHAHRLSLLKHTCTIRHQKAAQLHFSRKVRIPTSIASTVDPLTIFSEGNSSMHEEDDAKEVVVNHTMLQYTTGSMDEEQDQELIEEEEEEESLPLETIRFQKHVSTAVTSNKPPISTHVLDTSKGTPVLGLQVSLYKLIDGRWTYINEGTTNPDGRFANFLEQSDFSPGRYKMHFDVDRYFELKKQESLYPFIEIVFDCKGPGEHYHIPLLLSPYGYTTYRGF